MGYGGGLWMDRCTSDTIYLFSFTSFFSEGFRKSSPCSFTVKTHGDSIERVLNICRSYGNTSKTSFVTTLNPRPTELSTARSHQGSA